MFILTTIRLGKPVTHAVVINDVQLISVSLGTKQITFYKEIIINQPYEKNIIIITTEKKSKRDPLNIGSVVYIGV